MAVRTEVIDGAEVRIETGRGLITLFDTAGQGRNLKVEFKATHTRLDQPVTGWADSQDRLLCQRLQEAVDHNAEIDYEVRVVRKRDVDRSIPFAELTSKQKVRELFSIGSPGSSSPPATASTYTPPKDTPPPATEASEGPASPGPSSSPARAVRRGLRVEEARPWERYNTDGSLNLGSYEVTACYGMTSLAFELILEKARQDAAATGAPLEAPDPSRVMGLATTLLQAADIAQATVRSDGCTDRLDASHSRARGALRTALDAYPVPWDARDAGDKRAWRDLLADTAAQLLSIAVSLTQLEPGKRQARPDRAPQEEPVSPAAGTPAEVPLSTQEADAVEEAQAQGRDPGEVLAAARRALEPASS